MVLGKCFVKNIGPEISKNIIPIIYPNNQEKPYLDYNFLKLKYFQILQRACYCPHLYELLERRKLSKILLWVYYYDLQFFENL